jgi:hypothetical protein
MGAAAGIIGGIASGLQKSGNQNNVNATPVAQSGPATFSSPQVMPSGNSGGMDWSQLADMAKSLSKKDDETKPEEKKPEINTETAPDANTSTNVAQ